MSEYSRKHAMALPALSTISFAALSSTAAACPHTTCRISHLPGRALQFDPRRIEEAQGRRQRHVAAPLDAKKPQQQSKYTPER